VPHGGKNWPEIDRDPRWHAWLLTIDPLSGQPRQELLNDAIASGSAARCIAFFQGFMREQGGSSAAPAHDRPKPAQSRSAGKATYTHSRSRRSTK